MKMEIKAFSIAVIILLLLPTGLSFEKNVNKTDFLNGGDRDMDRDRDRYSESRGDDGVKIYGNHMFAQSFRPWFENLTYVNLSVEVHKNISPFLEFLLKLLERILPDIFNFDFLHNLTISIRSDLYDEDLVSKSFTSDEVKNCGGKLVWKLDKEYTLVHGIDDPYWEEHGLEPINEDYNSKTFYIVVRASGGDDKNYYTWKYGESYNEGIAWEWVESANEWRMDTYNVQGKDFDFELDGCLAWERAGDGIVKQYNIVDLWDQNENKVVPFLRGKPFTFDYWNGSNEDKLKAIDEIDRLCDGDDVILLWLTGEGSYYSPKINRLSASRIEKHFERIPTPSGGICMIFDCCYAGQFTDPSKSAVCKPGRVIMASCADWETETGFYVNGELWVAFNYYLYQGLQEGYKTAEELFNYASTKHNREEQIYDTYPGELQIAE